MILSGIARLGRDAEVRYIPSGTAVSNLSLAFAVGFGERKDTTWIDASLWGKQAESLSPHLTKGKLMEVALSEIKLETYGENKSKITAKVVEIGFVPGQGGGDNQSAPPPKPAPAPAPAQSFEDFDDDLPF